MSTIRVAVVGVGNCASSLIQGVEYYKDADPSGFVPGLMHVQFGPYHVRDVEFVAAFDVDNKKVGLDLCDAINASENNTIKLCDVPRTGVTVQRGHTLDGLGKYYREMIQESDAAPVDVVAVLKETRADIVVCYLPVGSEAAAKFYAQCAIDAGCGFVNALPVFIAGTPEWAKKFADAGLPIVGDELYGGPPLGDGDERERPILLHAWRIDYADPDSGERVTVEAPLPDHWPAWARPD
jgi:myo-inositol-1-phosphate synthase